MITIPKPVGGDKKPFCIMLPVTLADRIAKIAADNGITKSYCVEYIIERGLESMIDDDGLAESAVVLDNILAVLPTKAEVEAILVKKFPDPDGEKGTIGWLEKELSMTKSLLDEALIGMVKNGWLSREVHTVKTRAGGSRRMVIYYRTSE